jgi:hypothetical protein
MTNQNLTGKWLKIGRPLNLKVQAEMTGTESLIVGTEIGLIETEIEGETKREVDHEIEEGDLEIGLIGIKIEEIVLTKREEADRGLPETKSRPAVRNRRNPTSTGMCPLQDLNILPLRSTRPCKQQGRSLLHLYQPLLL